MIKLGLTGYPVGHSLSPAIQNAALQASGLEGGYSLYPVAATITTAGNYQFRISLKNMVDGDKIEITNDVEANSDETSAETIYYRIFEHAQGTLAAIIETPWIAIPGASQLIAKIKRLAGSDRAYRWSILTQ